VDVLVLVLALVLALVRVIVIILSVGNFKENIMFVFMSKTSIAQIENFVDMDLDLHVYSDRAIIKSFIGGPDFVISDTNINNFKQYLTINLDTLEISDTDDISLPILGIFLKFDTQTRPILVIKDTPFEDQEVNNVSMAGGSYDDLVNIIYPYINLNTGTTTFSTRHVRHLISGVYTFDGFNTFAYTSEFDNEVAESSLTVTKVSNGMDMFNPVTRSIDLSAPGSYIVTIGNIDYDSIVQLPIKRPHIPWFSYKLTVS
jgi:hypothetical protein